MRCLLRMACFAVLLAVPGTAPGIPADRRLKPSAEDFAKLHAFLRPRPEEEKWMQIPWMIDLWEARKKAAAEGKPILLWEMDGSPLGCG
jgi:hypothetical protein